MTGSVKLQKVNIHPKSVTELKEKIKYLTLCSSGLSDARRKKELKLYIRGWVNYFKLADMRWILLQIVEWYRRRLRMVIWKQWKRVKTKGRNLIKLGLPKNKAWEFANTRKGYWRSAGSPIMQRTITNNRLLDAGYFFFSDYYRLKKVKIKEPPYTRTVRTVV
jgi:RNA-directed DNA polymerase